MVVVKIEMWPKGDRTQARVLSVASLACVGEARERVKLERPAPCPCLS